jgi:Alcohol dehydrogenase GroES-like domain
MPTIPLPERMTVVAIREPGGPEVLTPELRPVPQPAAGEILVKVAAAGVNRPDIMQRMGLYPPPPGATDIPGLEIAGEVVALGSHVTRWKNGDMVMALVVGGGCAQYCLAHESHALPAPQTLSPIEAAAIPETYFTVWHNVFERGRLAAGETLLFTADPPASSRPPSSSLRPSALALSRPQGRRKNAPPVSGSARMSRLTTETKISSPRPRRRPANEAPTSSST